MKITAQEEYGLRCLLRVAQAEDSLTIPEVASAEGLSVPYVAKLLAVLRQAGVIDSVRGRSGGYRLSLDPAQIPVGGVLNVLGEPLFEEGSYCQRYAGTETDGVCVHKDGCTLRDLWHTLEQWVRDALDQITLADLLNGEMPIGDLVRDRLMKTMMEPAGGRISLMG